MSHQEALFCMGAQATGHEKAIRECPDHSTGKHNEATQRSGKVTWLETNSLLFHHTLEYQNNMIQLITRSQEAIQALHEHIWKVVCQVMESAGKSADGWFGNCSTSCRHASNHPLATDFQHSHSWATRVYTQGPRLRITTQHRPRCYDCTRQEILKGACGADEKVMQATWHVTVTNTGSVQVTMIGSEGSNCPNHPGTSLSPAPHGSTSMDRCTTGY